MRSSRTPTLVWLLTLVAFLAAPFAAPAVAQAQEPPAAEHAQEPAPGEHAQEPADDHAEAGDQGGGEHYGPSWEKYLYKWINFFLMLALLWWLLVVPPAFVKENFDFPGLKVLLAARSKEIVESRDLARQQKEESKTRLADSEARLAKVEQEAAALVAEAQEDADRERLRQVAAAEAEAAKIRQVADRDMGAEVARARRQLRRHVADLSVALAADLVKDNFSGADQDRLVREYLDRLGQTVS